MASAFPSFTQSVQGPPGPSQTIAALVPAHSKRGLLGRFLDALIESRRREAQQHIARLLAHAITRQTQSTGYGTFRDREVIGGSAVSSARRWAACGCSASPPPSRWGRVSSGRPTRLRSSKRK